MHGGTSESWGSEEAQLAPPDDVLVRPVAVIFPLPGGRGVVPLGWVPAPLPTTPSGESPPVSTAERRRWFARRRLLSPQERAQEHRSEELVSDTPPPPEPAKLSDHASGVTDGDPGGSQVGIR